MTSSDRREQNRLLKLQSVNGREVKQSGDAARGPTYCSFVPTVTYRLPALGELPSYLLRV